jgi:hypothetical protein
MAGAERASARSVTDMVVGCGGWLAVCGCNRRKVETFRIRPNTWCESFNEIFISFRDGFAPSLPEAGDAWAELETASSAKTTDF